MTDPGDVTVILSRRNLLALLHKLEMEGSARTIVSEFEDGTSLTMKSETDDEHYNHPARDPRAVHPGRMHPETENFIERSTT